MPAALAAIDAVGMNRVERLDELDVV